MSERALALLACSKQQPMAAAGACVSSCNKPAGRLRVQDTLLPTAQLLQAVLGPEHAVSRMLAEAAEGNLSPAMRSARRERENIEQASANLVTVRCFAKRLTQIAWALMCLGFACPL